MIVLTDPLCLSSRGAQTPRDLTIAQALLRYIKRDLQMRSNRSWMHQLRVRGPSPSARLGMTREAARPTCHENVTRKVLTGRDRETKQPETPVNVSSVHQD